MTLPPATPTRVWDLPTRLFHWLLAAALVGSVTSGTIGGNAMVWHLRFGYCVFALLAFRIVWGFVGGRWSRFASFLYAPGTVMRYLRGRAAADEPLDVGHNPLGAFSVFALLALLALQVATGLVADDEIATTGPLNRFVSSATATAATGWHAGLGITIVLVLVALHVAAIVFYRLRRGKDLVGPMVRGDKLLPAGTPASRDDATTRLAALVLASGAGALVAWVVSLGG
jgi:cytochrome b